MLCSLVGQFSSVPLPEGCRDTTENVATLLFHISLSSAALGEYQVPSLPSICPFSFHCSLQNCLQHVRQSCDVAILYEIPHLHHG